MMRRHTRRKVITSKVKTNRIRRRATVRIHRGYIVRVRRCGTIDGRRKAGTILYRSECCIIDRATIGTISYRSREEIGVQRKGNINLKMIV